MKPILHAVLFAALTATLAFPQAFTGSISGIVSDSTDAVLPGTSVLDKSPAPAKCITGKGVPTSV